MGRARTNTTPGRLETSLTIEEPAASSSIWQSDDTDSAYVSDDSFDDHDSPESTSGPSESSDTSDEATHSPVQDSSSSDQVLALVTRFGSWSLSAEGFTIQASLALSADSNPQQQHGAAANTAGIASASIHSGEDEGTMSNEAIAPEPVHDETQIHNVEPSQPAPSSANIQLPSAQPGHILSTSAAPTSIVATRCAGLDDSGRNGNGVRE